jgi:hypothetical protein
VAAEALAGFLVIYLALLLVSYLGARWLRTRQHRDWTDRAILRASSLVAFAGGFVAWLVIGALR